MQRKSNFELLRIAAMLLIIGSHLASHGIQHVLGGAETYHIWMEGSNLNRGFVALLTPGGTVGAALFFMITGYFRVNKEEIKVVGIILESLFYGMLIVLFTLIIIIWDLPVPGLEMKEMVSFSIMAVLNPASSGIWWFISAYLLLLFLLPVINKLLLSLNKKKYLFFIGAFWVVWYTIASLGSQYIYLERAIFFYVLGAYCRLHLKKTGRKLIYGVIAAVSWIVGSFLQYASDLRKILMIMRLATEYERIADYTKNLAEYIILIKQKESLEHYEKNVDKLVYMIELVIKMLTLVIEGLKEENKTKVKEAADLDKKVDEVYNELMASLITHIQVVDGKVFGTAYAILINKYIERAGDHVTNIAEEVLYALKGHRYHLN